MHGGNAAGRELDRRCCLHRLPAGSAIAPWHSAGAGLALLLAAPAHRTGDAIGWESNDSITLDTATAAQGADIASEGNCRIRDLPVGVHDDAICVFNRAA